MASVIDHNGKEIALRDCTCGAEPEYHTANGLGHVIRCTKCRGSSGIQRCGIDAVTAWNDEGRYDPPKNEQEASVAYDTPHSLLVARCRDLEEALRPFAELADTWTVQQAAQQGVMLTLSNGQRMCGVHANDFIEANKVLRKTESN